MTMQQTTNSTEIIDATQTAVIQAADSVAKVIENTATEISGHHGKIYEGPEFWVAVAFIMVVVLLSRPIGKLVHKMLSKRIETITNRIDEASRLKDDAQKLLVEYEKKYKKADEEAQAILDKSKKEIEYIKDESMKKLEREMAIKEKEAHMRINASQLKASQEISNLTAEMTINAVKIAITKSLTDKSQDKLIDNSIKLISDLK